MAYVPDPENVLTPLDSDVIGNVTPPEIRAIKQHIIDKFEELKLLLQSYNTVLTQQQTQIASNLNSALADVTALIPSKLDPHIADKENPHGTTKAHLNLDKVNNWPASSEVDLDSTSTYATAAAVKSLASTLATLNTSITNAANRRTALINASAASVAAQANSTQFQNALNTMVGKDMLYAARIFTGNSGTWKNETGKTAVVLEARRTSNANANIVHIVNPNATYNYVATENFMAYVIAQY